MRRFIVLAAFLGSMTAALVSGQTTTGRLIGITVDDSGAVLPGVRISIDSPALIGGSQITTTDEKGEFAFLSLAPGEYRVRAAHADFITQERSRIKVPLGGAAAITIAMPMASFAGEIEVVNETPVVDPTQVNTGQIFRQDYMQNSAIGSANRNYTTVVNQTAGVASGSWGMDQPKVFGSTVGENAYFIDGVDTTDPVMGTATVTMNFDAVAEIQFQTGGFEAEYGRATGGILNLVTRSGGNRISGTFDARYRDGSFQESGEYFDSSELSLSYQNFAATLGGPIVRDRVWFFASYQRIDEDETPVGAHTTRMANGRNYLGKITWQISPAWRLVGKYSSDPYDTENGNSSRWTMPEATGHSEGGTRVISGELNSVLSDSLMWNTTLGQYNYVSNLFPQSGNLSAIGHYNFDTGLNTGNYGNQQYWESNRNDFTTDFTWFVDDLAGSHELKGGVEYSGMKFTATNCSTGTPNGERCVADGVGFYFNDIEYDGPLPWLMIENHTSGPTTYDGAVSTAFAQDAWRPGRNVTLKIGFRYDVVTYDTTNGTQIADMSMLQPRFGVAWDLTGDAKNILRGSWGRFLHPNALTLPWHVRPLVEPVSVWYSCSGLLPLAFEIPIGSRDECAAVAAGLGWDHQMDHENWDPYGWVLAPWEQYSSEPSQSDPAIRPTYADELILGFEREVGIRSSIEFTFVDKKTRDVVDDTCNGNWPTPTADAACDYYFLGNIPGLKRDYRGFIVRFETRGFDWLTLLASYTYSTSKGSVEYTQNAGTVADVYPWHFENRYGYLSDHRKHRLKLNGFFNIKGDWTIAFDSYWSSPFTWEPYENRGDNLEIPYGWFALEPRGNRDANSTYQLDLQVAKGFTAGRMRFVLIASVLNAFGDEQPSRVCEHISGCGFYDDDSPIEMADPLEWQLPRRYEVGFRVEF
jgi:hypothetical protein